MQRRHLVLSAQGVSRSEEVTFPVDALVFASTAGNVSQETIQRYIEAQRRR
jgi:hypothetical protein